MLRGKLGERMETSKHWRGTPDPQNRDKPRQAPVPRLAVPSSSEPKVRPWGLKPDAWTPPPASAHSPDSGEVADLAVHLKQPTVVGKQQFQGLAEEEDARHPDPRGEDGHAEKCPCLWAPVGATSIREGERTAGGST